MRKQTDLSKIRKEYRQQVLNEGDMLSDPLKQLSDWIEAAARAGCREYTAMSLATVDQTGQPSVRIVLLKYLNEKGLCFFTNYNSRKGFELENNPKAAALFFWTELERQVRIEGSVEKLSPELSDLYFGQRPFESQISARVSPQSRLLANRAILEQLWQEEAARWQNQPVERPADWGGYCLVPHRFEFWQGRSSRLHDRIGYQAGSNGWSIFRLAP